MLGQDINIFWTIKKRNLSLLEYTDVAAQLWTVGGATILWSYPPIFLDSDHKPD